MVWFDVMHNNNIALSSGHSTIQYTVVPQYIVVVWFDVMHNGIIALSSGLGTVIPEWFGLM